MSKSVFGYSKTKQKWKKKVPMAIKLEGGGGKVLMARPLVEEVFFLRLPLIILKISFIGIFLLG